MNITVSQIKKCLPDKLYGLVTEDLVGKCYLVIVHHVLKWLCKQEENGDL